VPFWKSWFPGRASRRAQPAARHDVSRKPSEPLWMRYRSAWPVLAILVLLVVIGGGALLVVSWLRPSGQVLTVVRPAGGTLTGPGIKCGSGGTDCTSRRPDGETVELTAQADNGFVFRGYTGDCAPGGLMIMRAARSCSATFEALSTPGPSGGPTQVLTINPVPVGGTLEGVDILCGTKGSVCTFNEPDGVPVELHPTADAGYTFMGFTGDCAPLGHTQMNGARTCGANFQKTDTLSQGQIARVPVVKPPVGGGSPNPGTGGSRGAGSGGPSGGPTVVEPSRGTPPAGGGPTAGGGVVAPPPLPPPPAGGQPQQPPVDVKPPISDEDYAKNAIKDVLKALCKAYEDLNPDAAQQVFPTINMTVLRNQLNKSQYKAVTCAFAEPSLDALDAQNGKAKIHVDVKRTFERAALGTEPDKAEQIAEMTLSRASQRGLWVIDTAAYRPKPKDK